MKYFSGTKAQVLEVQALVDMLFYFPRRGVLVGGGQFPQISMSYAEGAVGWTAHKFPTVRHPKIPARWATACDHGALSDVLERVGDKLPEQARARLAALAGQSADLDSSWELAESSLPESASNRAAPR